MPEWHALLDQLEIPDGAVAGLSAADKPVLRGKLLQLPAADRPLFFVGQPLDVLKTLRTLLPDAPSVRQEQHGQQQIFDADAEFFKKLEQTGWLPSASEVGDRPKLFARLRDHANILNHRPINHHGVPLPLMHEAFGEFVDIFNTGIPTHSDCNFAVDLCKVASEVWESETKQLQPGLHTLFVKYFEGFEVRSATPVEAEPDERMIYNKMDIGAWELKTDSKGNTYGQVQRYYVAVVQSLQQAKSPVLALSCVPMLYMELSGATLRVCGAAALQHQFLCEPLTPALHLYCVNNPAHMDAVVRCVSAIRRTLSKLATFHQQLDAQASPTPYQQTPSACLPYYFATAYPEASVQQLLSQTRLIFLVTTTNGQQRLVKFVPFCQNRSQGGTQAHRAWADARCAPDLLHVKSLCGHWCAVEMEYLAPRDGWFPLYILAPQRGQTVPMQAGSQQEPLSAPAWQHASALATQALEHAQQHATVQLDGHKHPTVHGDVRLPNIIGHVVDGNKVDRVVFVDFDWAGLQDITRYPALMNPDIAWPTGAQPFAHLQQVHDKELLCSELQKGSLT